MKRALTAAIVGGLLAFSVPQAAMADHEGGAQEATQPEAAEPEAAEPEGSPPKEQPYADRESRGDEEEEFLLF
jgi:hypothetical protein